MFFSCFSLILFPISFIIHKANLEGTENIKWESTFADANLIAPQKRLNQKNIKIHNL
ncbi:MAG: hypothetical protein BWY27_01616 [Bacteroidetes bacterium ADurb.Bin234]|nr:MAG: hypothetical protein BWY27_01616 [Bacteroidetes bacterium ADurb.Bin234]